MRIHRVPSFSFLLVCICCAFALCGCATSTPGKKGAEFELVLLHTNDTHSYMAGRDTYGNACVQSAGCVGGMGRVAAAIEEQRAGGDNVLALDAGDQFQGTLFYTVNKWPMLADIDRLVAYDAVTLGNHEFDEGCPQAADFVRALPYPVLAANLDAQPGCPLRDAPVRPWLIREIRGVKVGIVGLANPEVRALASACPQTRFTDNVQALKNAVSALEKQGVRHIIVVSHLGLPEDRRLARAVDGVDVIVGGHTHSYLGPDSKEGPYPVVEHAPSGQPVLVVTAKFATEYLGELRVAFDGQGVPSHWQGGPRRLDASVTPDAAVESKVANYAKRLEGFRAAKLGAIDLDFPDGMEACRQGDCLAGLITTDAMLEYGRAHGAVAALLNGGSLRAPMKRGELTQGDLLAVLPFGNMLVIREYSGEQLLAALEHGVSGEKAAGPRILQVSGLRYSVDATKSAGSRVLSAEISDVRGQTRVLDKNTRYRVVLPSYLARGGDGYAMLVQGRSVSAPDPMDADVVGAYIKTHSPLKMPRTGRIDKATP